MSKLQQILWAIVIVIVLISIYWWWSSSSRQPATTPAQTSTQTGAPFVPATSTASTTGQAGSAAPMAASVTYNGTSFSPANVTIGQGGTVTFTSTAGPMWVASDPHPLHNGYDGTTMQQHCAPRYTGPAPFDQCSEGTSFSFTFNKVGTWGYHNHLNEAVGGTISVVAQ